MEVARITTKGQITIPIEIRKKLNLKEGDKIIFLEQDGRIYFENAALLAFNRIQNAMADEAQKAGYNSLEEMNELVKEIRKEMWEERYENNDWYQCTDFNYILSICADEMDTRHIEGKLWEVKFYNHNRIFYALVDSDRIYLLHACKKQKNKAERFELKTARKRMGEINK